MADQEIRLGLDMGPTTRTAAEATRAMDALKTSVKSTADAYEVLERQVGTYAAAEGHLQTAMDAQVRKAVEATQAQKAMNLILEETARAQVTVGTAATQSIGGQGRGLLGISYALQDFTSVATGGGGVVRALSSITNNFDQLAMAAGASVKQAAAMSIGFTGLVAVLPLVTPLVEAFWRAMTGGGAGPEPVVKAVDAIEARIAKLRAELEKIMGLRPFQEKETQGRIEEYFAEVGPEKLLGGAARAIGATGRGAKMTAQEAAEIGRQEEILAGGTLTGQERLNVQDRISRLREAAQKRISGIDTEAAGKMIAQAPTSAAARRGLAALAGQAPGMFPRGFAGELGELEPEAVARQEEEVTAAEEMGKRLHEAGQRRQAIADVNRQAPDLMKGPVEQFQRQQAEQLKAGRDAMQEATDEFKDLQRQQQQEAREKAQADRASARSLEQEAMGAAVPIETPRAQARRQLGEYTSQISQQQGYGMPSADQASEMADQAMRNMSNGMNAAAASWMAVQQKMEAIRRTSEQFSGMFGRMQSTPWPTGLPR